MTAHAAAGGIRKVDQAGSIGVIGAEAHPPYDRPPLSKGLWKDKPFDSVWRKSDDLAVTFHLGRKAQRLDARKKTVTDDEGATHTYDKLLLATGASPKRLPFGGDDIIYYRPWTTTSGCASCRGTTGDSRSSAGDSSARRWRRRWR